MLENTLYRIEHDRKLNIGFFGGSITEGAGASDQSKTSWRGAVTQWFAERFQDCAIVPIQAAIGGTGSSLGVFRLERDLLSKNPDLVFIEFSVNDGLGNYDSIMSDSEAIVRKIYASNPLADIIYVHTTTKSICDHIASGGEYTARSAHSAVMHRYGIPQLDMGEILRARVCEAGGDWKLLTRDTVHPNDDGYAIYTKAVTDFLSEQFERKGEDSTELQPCAVKLPEPIAKSDRTEAELIDASKCAAEPNTNGWKLVEKSLCGRYPCYIEASEPGSSFKFRFSGRRIGIYLMLAKDSGDIVYSVDGGEEKTLRTWDHYCKSFNRAGGMMLGGELEAGIHTLAVRVSDVRAEESEGTVIRIGAFMVY